MDEYLQKLFAGAYDREIEQEENIRDLGYRHRVAPG